jgi:mono/diheme cytochrome c family protein
MQQLKLCFLIGFIGVGLLLHSWPTQAGNLQVKNTQGKPTAPPTSHPRLKSPEKTTVKRSVSTNSVQVELTPEQTKSALKNWVALCAPCHTVQATGTENGPALLGEKALKQFTVVQLKKIFAAPEKHGLSEAIPAFRKLDAKQREELAIWFSTLKKPEDIVVATDLAKPPPFIFVQNCAGCHSPDGTGGVGPNLYNVSKRRERAQILKLIEDPSSVGVKTNIMPTFSELSEEERVEIVNWLMALITETEQ